MFVGHPILNDPLYNHLGGGDNGSGGGGMGGRDDSSGGGGVSGGDDSSGGDEMGGDLARISEPCHATEKINKCLKEKGGNELDKGQEKDIHRMCLETSKDKEEKEGTCSGDIKESPTNDFDSSYDKDCTECQLRSPPSPKELTMYLHALSYKVILLCKEPESFLLIKTKILKILKTPENFQIQLYSTYYNKCL